MLMSASLQLVANLAPGHHIPDSSIIGQILLKEFRRLVFQTASIQNTDVRTRLYTCGRITRFKILEAFIVFKCIVLGEDEMAYDGALAEFDEMLQLISTELHSNGSCSRSLSYHPFSTVFIPPLWLAASRCRRSDIRQIAIGLLWTARRREALYCSWIVATLAQAIASAEGQYTGANDTELPLLAQRATPIDAQYCFDSASITLSFRRQDGVLRTTEIPWTIYESWRPDATALNEQLSISKMFSKRKPLDSMRSVSFRGELTRPIATTNDGHTKNADTLTS